MSSESKDTAAPAATVGADRLVGFDAPSVWLEFTPLAKEYGAVNLGQGFPDWPAPDFVKAAAAEAIASDDNQYTRSAGHVRLVQALAKRYSRVLDRDIKWDTEVTCSVGATEAIFVAIQAHINPGDEVLLMEPFFDIYAAQAQMAGGKCSAIPLRLREGADGSPSSWYLDLEELEKALTDKTKILMLNTPHNPTGKLFSVEEIAAIGKVLEKYPNVIVVADEVYEHLTYGKSHVHVASVPGMWDRTLTVSSAGKTFSVTGWKIGWLVGPPQLIKPIILANQWVQFSVCTPLQAAIGRCLEVAEQEYKGFPTFFHWLRDLYSGKRKKLMDALAAADLDPVAPEGSFFIMADTRKYAVPDKYLSEGTPACPEMTRDWAFCRWLAIEHGVVAIPPSAFYRKEDQHLAANLARFAFCKTDDSLEAAAKNLAKFAESAPRV